MNKVSLLLCLACSVSERDLNPEQVWVAHLGIDTDSLEANLSQKTLYVTNVSASFQKRDGKGMT
jgi:hypothetical protein